jgi:hypothetical protein
MNVISKIHYAYYLTLTAEPNLTTEEKTLRRLFFTQSIKNITKMARTCFVAETFCSVLLQKTFR